MRSVDLHRMFLLLAIGLAVSATSRAEVPQAAVPLQPFAVLAHRVVTTLDYLGQPLATEERTALEAALARSDETAAVDAAAEVLDRRVLLEVNINPESRVKVRLGAADPALVEAGTRVFLVKVFNHAGITAPLRISSPQSQPVSIPSWTSNGSPEPDRTITPRQIEDRWADVSLYDKPPMTERLSGLPLEYRVLEVYSRDRGQRAAELRVDVGQGTEDIGFRGDLAVVFTAAPAREVTLRVQDERGRPAMTRLTVRDAAGRIYPAPSKRLAPDLPFQPQIYRADEETLRLPDGRYTFTTSGGPEYLTTHDDVTIGPEGANEVHIRQERWIDPAAAGWYSGDHHVHAAGCSHYQDPTAGVKPDDMIRQVRGEGLNIGSVLTWGPCYYYQKRFFSGQDDPESTEDTLLHYDVEISGFPSSHAGHLVLLGLTDQDYPDTRRLEDWPTFTLPVLKWAKGQGAVTGYAHSGWGLEIAARDLPAAELPAFDGIGANEFIVTVTHPDAVDFISLADTPWPWELNIWYHVLNAGFRTRVSGETDFPCIYDDRVGLGRTYAKLERLSYRGWIDAVRAGRSYVSDGLSHLMDFTVNGVGVGEGASEVVVNAGEKARASVRVTARLEEGAVAGLPTRPADEKPYWDLERARIDGSRDVPVEFLVNGRVVATRTVPADGEPHDVQVDLPVTRSAWVAVRILPSSHTNPIWVLVDGAPLAPTRSSVEWSLAAVDQCWRQKVKGIRESELDAAEAAYEHARTVYRRLLTGSVDQ